MRILSRTASFQHNMKWAQNFLCVAIPDSPVSKNNKHTDCTGRSHDLLYRKNKILVWWSYNYLLPKISCAHNWQFKMLEAFLPQPVMFLLIYIYIYIYMCVCVCVCVCVCDHNNNNIIIIIYSFRVFHISVNWWFFTGVWVTASLMYSRFDMIGSYGVV